MSELGDLIIASGPYVGGHRMSEILAAVVDRTEINALRDELIQLRAIAAKTESDQGSAAGFDVMAINPFRGTPDISLRCTRCVRWAVHIDRPVSLRDLNERAQEHAEVCR